MSISLMDGSYSSLAPPVKAAVGPRGEPQVNAR
jgi:hypothetical protein